MKRRDKPYVGQHAYYREQPGDDPMPAIVTYVGSSVVVNVCIFDREGSPQPLQAVNYWDGKGPEPTARMVSEQ